MPAFAWYVQRFTPWLAYITCCKGQCKVNRVLTRAAFGCAGTPAEEEPQGASEGPAPAAEAPAGRLGRAAEAASELAATAAGKVKHAAAVATGARAAGRVVSQTVCLQATAPSGACLSGGCQHSEAAQERALSCAPNFAFCCFSWLLGPHLPVPRRHCRGAAPAGAAAGRPAAQHRCHGGGARGGCALPAGRQAAGPVSRRHAPTAAPVPPDMKRRRTA